MVSRQQPVPLPIQTYESRSRAGAYQRLVNMYAEPNIAGKGPISLFSFAGAKVWADIGTSPMYGVQEMGGNLYVVSGGDVYQVTKGKTATLIGSIGTNSQPVAMETNGTQVAIKKSDGTAYIATSSSVVQITDISFPSSVSSLTYIDGYFIFSETNTNKFYWSSLLDGTTYDATDFASAAERPDNLRRVIAFNSGVWCICDGSYEVFYNSGDSNNLFQQIPGAVNTTLGSAAEHAVVEDDNRIFFLGNDKIIYAATGYSAERISTYGIEQIIEEMSTISDTRFSVYEQFGHKFLVCTFPTGKRTLVYDMSTGLWCERSGVNNTRWLVDYTFNFAGKAMGLSYSTGHIYEFDQNTYTDNNATLQRILHVPVIHDAGNRMIHDAIRLDVDSGLGLVTGQGSDPQVVMTYSDDGGNTYSTQRWQSVGMVGDYSKRSIWRRNGESRQRLYKFLYTEPTDFRVTGIYGSFRGRNA